MNSRQWYFEKLPFVSEYFSIAFGSFRQFSGGYSTKFYQGRLRHAVQPPYPFTNHFDRKGSPFLYLLLTVGTPFTYLVTKALTLLTYVNALQLKYENNTKPGNFLDFFSALNSSVSPFKVFLQTEMKDYRTHLYTFTSEISKPCYT